MLNLLVPIFKGKRDPLNPNCYRGIKLLEHAFKLYEKVLDGRLHEVVDIDKCNMSLCQGEGLLMLCLFLRDLVKNSEPKIRSCFLYLLTWNRLLIGCQGKLFVLLLRQKDVPEYLVNGVMSLYKGCKTAVSVDGEVSSSFSVKVGVHQLSALSPLLFITVMDVLTKDVRDGSLMELLYADDLVLWGEPLNAVMDKYGRWKNAVEGKGLRVNVNKIKGMQLLFGKKVVFQKWILVVSVVSGLVVRDVGGGFINAVLMCLGR